MAERQSKQGTGRARKLEKKRTLQPRSADGWRGVDFRKEPEKYRVGRGEQGVLAAEPYKSEMLPHWKFATPVVAKRSAGKLYSMYLQYKREGDFVGMDLARKFIQMGYTRARRYATHKGGRKYGADGREVRMENEDAEKAESALVFKEKWDRIRGDGVYVKMKKEWGLKAGTPSAGGVPPTSPRGEVRRGKRQTRRVARA